MRNTLLLASLLCVSAVVKADGFRPMPDESLTRGDEQFEVAIKGFTGAHIDVRTVVRQGRRCSIRTATDDGVPVCVDILMREGENGKKLLELKIAVLTATGPGSVASITDLFAPGESAIRGDGWNNLFEVRLGRADGPR